MIKQDLKRLIGNGLKRWNINPSFLSNNSTVYISDDKVKEIKPIKRKKNSAVEFLVDIINNINHSKNQLAE